MIGLTRPAVDQFLLWRDHPKSGAGPFCDIGVLKRNRRIDFRTYFREHDDSKMPIHDGEARFYLSEWSWSWLAWLAIVCDLI